MAVGALKAVQEAKIAVPQRLALISFNDTALVKYVYPSMSAVHVATDEMAHAAVEMMIKRLRRPDADPCKTVVGTHLIKRQTTKWGQTIRENTCILIWKRWIAEHSAPLFSAFWCLTLNANGLKNFLNVDIPVIQSIFACHQWPRFNIIYSTLSSKRENYRWILARKLSNSDNSWGLTQADVANQLFVTRQTISSWEQGKSYPDLNMLVRLSEVYQVSLDSLLKGDE